MGGIFWITVGGVLVIGRGLIRIVNRANMRAVRKEFKKYAHEMTRSGELLDPEEIVIMDEFRENLVEAMCVTQEDAFEYDVFDYLEELKSDLTMFDYARTDKRPTNVIVYPGSAEEIIENFERDFYRYMDAKIS